MQLNLTRGADLQDVPLITEFAKNDRQRQMLKLILSRQEMARPFMAPPGIPDDRKAALRKAFDDAWADPELLAEMKARGQEVNPVSGAALDALIAELYATPKDVVEETRRAIGGSGHRLKRAAASRAAELSPSRTRFALDAAASPLGLASRTASPP